MLLLLPLLMYFGGHAMLDMPGQSYKGELPVLTAEQTKLRAALQEHVRVLSQEIGDRNVRLRYDQLKRSADYVERALHEMGYGDIVSETYKVRGRDVRNLSVEIAGAKHADQIVIVGAHYDSVEGCPAANDNGSGVA